MAVSSPNGHWILSIKTVLDENFKIRDFSELKFILDILITYDHARYLIYLNQLAYICQVLMCFGIQDTYPVSNPLVVKYELSMFHFPKTKIEKQAYKAYTKDIHCLSLVGSLLFAI